jgi:hypothetical protein
VVAVVALAALSTAVAPFVGAEAASAAGSRSAAAEFRPDALVRPVGGTYLGDGVYGTDGVGQTVSATVPAGEAAQFDVLLQNDGTAVEILRIAGSPTSAIPGINHYWAANGNSATQQVDEGRLVAWNLPPGGTFALRFSVRPALSTPAGTVAAYSLKANHDGSSIADLVGIRITVAAPLPTFSTSEPTVEGIPKVGVQLVAHRGEWTPSDASFEFVWKSNSRTVGTGPTYTPTISDISRAMSVTVIATRAGYATATRVSKRTAPVAPEDISPGTPTISGTAQVGQLLTANTGTWTPTPTTFIFQWYRNGTAIDRNGTESQYRLTSDDRGAAITVVVTGYKSNWGGASATSAPTATVLPGTITGPRPAVYGTAEVGRTLGISLQDSWTPYGVRYLYRWLENGVIIPGETRANFVPTAAQVGSTISVKVIGMKDGYTTTSRTSLPTSPVIE